MLRGWHLYARLAKKRDYRWFPKAGSPHRTREESHYHKLPTNLASSFCHAKATNLASNFSTPRPQISLPVFCHAKIWFIRLTSQICNGYQVYNTGHFSQQSIVVSPNILTCLHCIRSHTTPWTCLPQPRFESQKSPLV